VIDAAAALEAWASGRGSSLDAPPEAVTGGLDTFIFRFRAGGRPMVLRLYPSTNRAPSAEKEAAVLGFLARRDYPAPRVVDWGSSLAGLPYVVMEEVPGETLLATIEAHLTRAPGLLDRLASAQARLHRVDPTGWPVPPPDEDDLFAVPPGDARFDAARAWLRANRPPPSDEPPVVCHLDFHPGNVLAEGAVIDWENSAVADRHADVARTLLLFEWAPVIATSAVERAVLGRVQPWLRRRYTKAYGPLDPARLHYWMARHAAQSWWEATTVLDGTFARDSQVETREGPARLVAPAMAKRFARLTGVRAR
jgi:aminoglycoside phosphotransferase (APT) family kinase protein